MIDIDFKAVNKLITKLKCTATKVQEAKQTAIRQVATETKNNWAKLIGEELNLPMENINQAIYARVTVTGFNVSVNRRRLPFSTPRSGSIPLVRFQPKQDSTGTSVLIKKTRGSQHVRHAFMARMKTGHVGVFLRRGSKRTPVKQLYSSSITDIASNRMELVQQTAVKQFAAAVTVELKKGC
jgi:hypothetical protein